MRYFHVVVLLDGKAVFNKTVKGKDKGRAVTNVLTNIYRGDMDSVVVTEVEAPKDLVVEEKLETILEMCDHFRGGGFDTSEIEWLVDEYRKLKEGKK